MSFSTAAVFPAHCKSDSISCRHSNTFSILPINCETMAKQNKLDSPMSRHSSRRDILDDIRNDGELLFGDDSIEESEEISLPPSLGSSQISRLPSFTSRRSSLIPMENLQREVDLALEMFTRENSDDEDELLENRHNSSSGFSIEKVSGIRFESEESGSYPGTASTSLATSCDYELSDCPVNKFEGEERSNNGDGLSLKHRTKSILSLPLSLLPSKPLMNCLSEEEPECKFDSAVGEKLACIGVTKEQHADRSFKVDFSEIRNEMEPFLASARKCLCLMMLCIS